MNVTIVGRGPSLLKLTAADFLSGPVITLNLAALHVRRIGLDNPLYLMQKDGCVPHSWTTPVPLGCRCPNPKRMITPQMPEAVVLSVAESGRCFPDYPNRMLIDVEQDFGLPWHTMSAPVAVRLAYEMGAREIRMLAFDARHGDSRRVEGKRRLVHGDKGYAVAVTQVEQWAETVDVALTWHRPVHSA